MSINIATTLPDTTIVTSEHSTDAQHDAVIGSLAASQKQQVIRSGRRLAAPQSRAWSRSADVD